MPKLSHLIHKAFVLLLHSLISSQGCTFFCLNHTTVINNSISGQIIIDQKANDQINHINRCEFTLLSPNKSDYSFIILTLLPEHNFHYQPSKDFLTIYDGSDYHGNIVFQNFDSNKLSLPLSLTFTNGELFISYISKHPGMVYKMKFHFTKCLNNCSSNGFCQEKRCICDHSWSGEDCSVSICPNDCTSSSHGVCDVFGNGKCECFEGAIGIDCQMSVNQTTFVLNRIILINNSTANNPSALTGHSSCYLNSLLWIFGGYNYKKVSDNLLTYDFRKNEWKIVEVNRFKPTARYSHSMFAFNQYLIVFGGTLKPNNHTNEVLLYSLKSNQWKIIAKNQKHSPKPSAFHSSVLIKSNYSNHLLVLSSYSGGLKSLNKFDINHEKWFPVHQRYSSDQQVLNSIKYYQLTYDPSVDVLITYGYKYSSDEDALLFFNFHSRSWSLIKPMFKPSSLPKRIPTNIFSLRLFFIGRFMVVFESGSKDTTFSFYDSHCNTWTSFSLNELTSYNSAVTMMKDIILIQGGIRQGCVINDLFAYQLPKLIFEPKNGENLSERCYNYKAKQLCIWDLVCQWCVSWIINESGYCISRNETCSSSQGYAAMMICQETCNDFNDCISCSTSSSYKLQENLALKKIKCGWSSSKQECFDEDSLKSAFSLNQCLLFDIPNGLYAIYYHDKSFYPSKVELVQNKFVVPMVSPKGVRESLIIAKGYLIVSSNKILKLDVIIENLVGFTRVKLENCQVNSTMIDFHSEIYFNHQNTSKRLRRNLEFPQGYNRKCELYIEIQQFAHHKSGYLFLKWSKENEKPFEDIQLQPFASNFCGNHTNCISCATDFSCSWFIHKCVYKTKDSSFLNQIKLISNPLSCPLCEEFVSCQSCSSLYCYWREDDKKCVAGKRTNSKCPQACESKSTCSDCLNSQSSCYWCDETETCHSQAADIEMCHLKTIVASNCMSCENAASCYKCLETMKCIWCDDLTNPYLGKCISSKGICVNNPNISTIQYNIQCPLIDECLLDIQNCDENAICINSKWSYHCRCKQGFVGDGYSCAKTCDVLCGNGYCHESTSHQCICDLGWTSSHSNFSNCTVDCLCNFQSTCSLGPGICDLCHNNTRGSNCERCQIDYYRNEETQNRCEPCKCNYHGVRLDRGGICDEDTGNCSCDKYTSGKNCEKCSTGLYGDSRNGSKCFVKCKGRIEFSDIEGGFGVDVNQLFDGGLCYAVITTNQTNSVIKLQILSIHNINCQMEQISVFDGFSEDSTLLTTFCDQVDSDRRIVESYTGVMVVILKTYKSYVGFDVTYQIYKNISNTSIQSTKIFGLYGHSLSFYNHSLYMYGGATYNFVSSEFYEYQLSTDTWSVVKTGSNTPGRRYFHAFALSSSNKLFIHGGFSDFMTFSDSNIWWINMNNDNKTWNRFSANVSSPQIAGHSMILIENHKLALIGGISKSKSYDQQIRIFDLIRENWIFINSSILLQSDLHHYVASYDQENHRLFVMATLQDDVAFFFYDFTSSSWFSMTQKPFKALISPSQLFAISQGIVFIDFLSSNNTWIYLFRQNNWIKVSLIKGRFSPINCLLDHFHKSVEQKPLRYKDIQLYKHFAAAFQLEDKITFYLFGGLKNGFITSKVQKFSISCEVNCSCFTTFPSCLNCKDLTPFECTSKTLFDSNDECPTCKQKKTFCESFRTCYDCMNETNLCEWCSASCQTEDTSINGKCLEKDLCFKRKSCFKNASCETPIVKNICKPNCFKCSNAITCTSCLQNNCFWIVKLKRCISRYESSILCTNGNCGVLIDRKNLISNDGICNHLISECNQAVTCRTCINLPRCIWWSTSQNKSHGLCREGNLSKNSSMELEGKTQIWSLMKCPLEDECFRGTHNCDKTQTCLDLENGFKCVCKKGYKLNVDTNTCMPVCKKGCHNGTCIKPNKCKCDFSFTGDQCQRKCQCNGMSDCEGNKCLKCRFNTTGEFCQFCGINFVGDPLVNDSTDKSSVCRPCKEICHSRSETCMSTVEATSRGPKSSKEVRCIRCKKSKGLLCEECLNGYFELNGTCERCRCRKLTKRLQSCNNITGLNCVCSPNSMSSKPNCNSQISANHNSDCWKFQCDKCKDTFTGSPRYLGSPCYKVESANRELCFDGKYCFNYNLHQGQPQLKAGQSVRFAFFTKMSNSNPFRILIDVWDGMVDVFIIYNSPSFYRISTHNDENFEEVIHQKSFNFSNEDRIKTDQKYRVVVADVNPKEIETTQIVMGSHDALQVKSLRSRLIVSRDYYVNDNSLFVIIIAKKEKERHRRDADPEVSGASGSFVLRQNKLRLDIFVFFTSCFSFFVLIVVTTSIFRKLRLMMSYRRARMNQALQLIPLARRPCKLIYVWLDSDHSNFSQSVSTHQSIHQPLSSPICSHSQNEEEKTSFEDSDSSSLSFAWVSGCKVVFETKKPTSSILQKKKMKKNSVEKSVRFRLPETIVPKIQTIQQPVIMQPTHHNQSIHLLTYLAVLPGGRQTPIFVSTTAIVDDMKRYPARLADESNKTFDSIL